MNQVNNPWTELPRQAPYVLEGNRQGVERFNSSVEPKFAFHLELLPEPFVGDPAAPVVLLNLNPGFNPKDFDVHQTDAFRGAARGNLGHAPDGYAFYPLDPRLSGAPVSAWWTKRLRTLSRDVGLQRVAQGLFCVQLLPYHSKEFRRLLHLPSQSYSRALVNRALDWGALVIGLRSRRLWEDAVPELIGYQNSAWLRNPRSPYVTPRNLGEAHYATLTSVLR